VDDYFTNLTRSFSGSSDLLCGPHQQKPARPAPTKSGVNTPPPPTPPPWVFFPVKTSRGLVFFGPIPPSRKKNFEPPLFLAPPRPLALFFQPLISLSQSVARADFLPPSELDKSATRVDFMSSPYRLSPFRGFYL